MNKRQELLNALLLHPERRLVVMFSSEDGNSDYAYTLGYVERVDITEMTSYNGERVIFSDDYDDLLGMIEDDIYSDKYGDQIINDEENAEIHQLAKEEIEKYKWESVIVAYVSN